MLSLKELKDLPLFSTLFILSIVGLSLFVPCLLFHYFKATLFYKLDLLKIILLCGGSGSVYFIVCFWACLNAFLLQFKKAEIKIDTFRDLSINASGLAFLIMIIGYLTGLGAVGVGWANNIKEYTIFGSIGALLTMMAANIILYKTTLPNNPIVTNDSIANPGPEFLD